MRHSVFLSALILSVSTIFYGCGSGSNTQQSAAPSEKEDQTVQTSSDVKGYSAENGTLTTYVQPALIDGTGKKLMAIYMVGSNLETDSQAGTSDLNELVEGYTNGYNTVNLTTVQKENLDIVVAFGGSDKDGWRGMKIATMSQLIEDSKDGIYGNLTETEYSYSAPLAHMGDESSLKLFVQYLKDGYEKHDQKILTMWDHGSAYGSFGNDSNFDGDGLTMAEMDNGFATAGLKFFDIIGYDACLNANFELASITQKYADYHIGSEELEPGHGWNYKSVVTSLGTTDGTTEGLETYGKEIIANYVDHDSHDYKSDGKTLSMVKLSEYAALKTAVDNLATYVNSNLSDDEVKESVIQSTNQSQQYGKSGRGDAAITIDLKGFTNGIAKTTDETEKTNLITAVNTALDNYVVDAKNDGTRPNSNGVSIVPPEGYDDYSEAVSSSTPWYTLTTKMKAIISDDSTSPTVSSENSNTDGTYATFNDSNLASVKTLYGNIITEADGTQYFATVASLPAEETDTTGEYFTPTWDKVWYIMSYGNNDSDNAWLPMQFENTYTEDSVTYTTYSAEIEYIASTKDYSKYPTDQKYDYAKLNVTVDEDGVVVLHNVRPYKILYQSADDKTGSVVYDKVTYELKSGDKINLLAEYFDMKTFESKWFYESDFTIGKSPTFKQTILDFTDEKDQPLDYYYMMVATDISGNWVNTLPVKVK